MHGARLMQGGRAMVQEGGVCSYEHRASWATPPCGSCSPSFELSFSRTFWPPAGDVKLHLQFCSLQVCVLFMRLRVGVSFTCQRCPRFKFSGARVEVELLLLKEGCKLCGNFCKERNISDKLNLSVTN